MICKKYNFELSRWTDIQYLTLRLRITTCSVVNNEIYLIGFENGHLIKYDHISNSYSYAEKLGSDCYKYLFYEYICLQDSLYEIQSDNQLIKYSINISDRLDALATYSGFKRNGFIYFVMNTSIYRIGTEKKIIEKYI